mmetsp:Transcript_23466/g.69122  ORF Transcript_23466/g.69122 Transcript_23466/m.69122 type:complete len:176 (-) Transcript_23466:204-731(-)
MKPSIPEAATLSSVAAFHTLFKVPVLDTPRIPNAQRCKLRVDLLQEELDELKAAIEENDLTEVADALADLQYVLAGAVHEFGLGECFGRVFEEVHRSNMSKACDSLEEAKATVEHYKATKGVDARAEKVNDSWLVYREADSKVLKSVRYSPPSIAPILASCRDENAPLNELDPSV